MRCFLVAMLCVWGAGCEGDAGKPAPAVPASGSSAAPATKDPAFELGGLQPGSTTVADFQKSTGVAIVAGERSAGEIQRASVTPPKLSIGETAADRLEVEFVDGVLMSLKVQFPTASTEAVRKSLTEKWGAPKEDGGWSLGGTSASLSDGSLTIVDDSRQKVAEKILEAKEVQEKEPKSP